MTAITALLQSASCALMEGSAGAYIFYRRRTALATSTVSTRGMELSLYFLSLKVSAVGLVTLFVQVSQFVAAFMCSARRASRKFRHDQYGVIFLLYRTLLGLENPKQALPRLILPKRYINRNNKCQTRVLNLGNTKIWRAMILVYSLLGLHSHDTRTKMIREFMSHVKQAASFHLASA